MSWVEANGGTVPESSVVGGLDNGTTLYVARGKHENAVLPGKLQPDHKVTYVAWGGMEHAKGSYEVLVAAPGTVSWISTREGIVPENAIPGGETEDGEIVFIGRALHEGSVTIGKVQPSHSCLYVSYGGKEISIAEYDILVKS